MQEIPGESAVLLDVTKVAGTEGRNAADFRPDLAAIQAMSTVLPGALPLAVNGVRVAASIRPRKFVIEGGDDTPVTMPRTAFQIVTPFTIQHRRPPPDREVSHE